jgi:hypothetical protein
MRGNSRSRERRGLVVVALALAVVGCASTAPTPLTVYITAPPGATPTTTPTAEATPTPADEPSPTESLAESPSESSAGSPSVSPTSPAAGCTGSETHKAYFVNAAKDMPFDIYCAVLPSGWWLMTSEYNRTDGGRMVTVYRNSADEVIVLTEGWLCASLSTCLDIYPSLGAAPFDGLAGTMRDMIGGGHGVVVNPHSIPGYWLYSFDLSQAKVAQYAAAVIKVPKPGS